MAEAILGFFDAVNRHDLDAIETFYHEDYKSVQPCFPSRNFEGPKAVRRVYEELFPRIPSLRYDIQRTSFTDHGDGRVTGFVEAHLTDDDGHNNVKGVIIMEVDNGKIREGSLYMTPVSPNSGDIRQYVKVLGSHKVEI
eukprot:jgi/Mesen1/3663/ME000202S02751